ncbi:hypothetical protein C8J56DRAFT_914198 [Mycena floridula]|nr:hypothetical protein C8J56DRAFT_914198 [Mycena floridula]
MSGPQTTETDSGGPFPELPNEIVLVILDALVKIQPRKALELVALSHNFRAFFEGYIYKFVCLSTSTQIASFVGLIRSCIRPNSFYHDQIRHLCIAYDHPALRDVIDIVSTCRNLQTLAIFDLNEMAIPVNDRPAARAALRSSLWSSGNLQPTRLSIPEIYMRDPETSWINLSHLERLTHLEICSGSFMHMDSDLQFNDNFLRHLPELTHLSYLGSRLLDAASSFASSLHLSPKTVVCIIWFGGVNSTLSWPNDHRIIFGAQYNDGPEDHPLPVLYRQISKVSIYLSDWGPRRSDERDMWELAEEIVELQHKSDRRGPGIEKDT